MRWSQSVHAAFGSAFLLHIACASGESLSSSAPGPTETGTDPSSTDPSATDPPTSDPPGTATEGPCGGGTVCGAECVMLDEDPLHCGECDNPCAAEERCSAGECVPACAPGEFFCQGECYGAGVEPPSCEGCGDICGDGRECVDGACVDACDAPLTGCGGACVDTQTDVAHCGGCDMACEAGDPCVQGGCDGTAVVHLLITGQSLSTGYASAVVSTMQPYGNLSFNTGVRAGADALTSFIPLVETTIDANQHGETIASGMANQAASLWTDAGFEPRDFLVSAHGVDGAEYAMIKKGTDAYATGLAQVTAGNTVASGMGQSYEVRAVTSIHGESDHANYPPLGNPNYAAHLLEWRADYEADIKAITGQIAPVRFFYCQMSSWTAYDTATSGIPEQQRQVAVQNPDLFYLVGPKYFLPYSDNVHLTGEGERWLGEYYAKALRSVYLDGAPWTPLTPTGAAIADLQVVIDFAVPVPPLVFDTTAVTDPGAYGFTFTDSSGMPPAISLVELTGPAQVTLTLAGPPGAGSRVGYANVGTPMAPAGPTSGPRGNLRDSDATVSLSGNALFNWAVHFELALN